MEQPRRPPQGERTRSGRASPPGSTASPGRGGTGWSSSGLGTVWILDGLEVTIVGAIGARAAGARHARSHGVAARPRRHALRRSAPRCGALVLRLPDRPLRAASGSSWSRSRVYLLATVATAFAWSFACVRALPLLHRLRDRRRVRGDQLGDRRADPGAGPRLGRPGDQRQLLAGRGLRRRAVRRPARHPDLPRRLGLAARLRPRRAARASGSCSSAATCPRARAG